MNPGPSLGAVPAGFLAALLLLAALPGPVAPLTAANRVAAASGAASPSGSNGSALGNFSAALGRLVTLLGAAGGAILAIAWARVALSWFSNDVTKKVQAKDRARDALIGSLIFAAALSGLIWGLARWVLGG
jgi:hypothetical protein